MAADYVGAVANLFGGDDSGGGGGGGFYSGDGYTASTGTNRVRTGGINFNTAATIPAYNHYVAYGASAVAGLVAGYLLRKVF